MLLRLSAPGGAELPSGGMPDRYFYLEGRGVEKDLDKSFYWTERAALHGDWDGQFNLGCFYEEGTAVPANMEKARHWYHQAALQGHELALQKCAELGITL